MDGRRISRPAEGGAERGTLLTAISNRIVGILREHYGRGPMRAKTYVLDDLIVCVLRDGFTAIEQTMIDTGNPERVVEMRHEFQQMMGMPFKEAIEELTGSRVVAFLSQAHVEPDITLEVFFVDPPIDGFGISEMVTPRRIDGEGEERPRLGRRVEVAVLPVGRLEPEVPAVIAAGREQPGAARDPQRGAEAHI